MTGRPGATLAEDLAGRNGGQQVLGGKLACPASRASSDCGTTTSTFTVTVAPARPGPNLVRLDVAW